MGLAFIGCHRESPPSPRGLDTTADAKSTVATKKTLPESVWKAMCRQEPCGSATATLDIYRDAAGDIRKVYRLYGSCFHSPGIFFDPDGKVLEMIPNKPVTRGSPEQLELAHRMELQIGGATHTETLYCVDGRVRATPR